MLSYGLHSLSLKITVGLSLIGKTALTGAGKHRDRKAAEPIPFAAGPRCFDVIILTKKKSEYIMYKNTVAKSTDAVRCIRR